MKDCEETLVRILGDDENLDSQLRELAGEGKSDTGRWKSSDLRKGLMREVAKVVIEECAGDDVEIIPAGGLKAIAPVTVEEDEGFDVAKK